MIAFNEFDEYAFTFSLSMKTDMFALKNAAVEYFDIAKNKNELGLFDESGKYIECTNSKNPEYVVFKQIEYANANEYPWPELLPKS